MFGTEIVFVKRTFLYDCLNKNLWKESLGYDCILDCRKERFVKIIAYGYDMNLKQL